MSVSGGEAVGKYMLHFQIKVQRAMPMLGLGVFLPEHPSPIRGWGWGGSQRELEVSTSWSVVPRHTASSSSAWGGGQQLGVPSSADFWGAACTSGTGPGGKHGGTGLPVLVNV